MQPKKQLKVQYIGIFEEIDSFYWPKMHFLKKGQKIRAWLDPPLPNSGNARKKTFFFLLMSSLSRVHNWSVVNLTSALQRTLCFGELVRPAIAWGDWLLMALRWDEECQKMARNFHRWPTKACFGFVVNRVQKCGWEVQSGTLEAFLRDQL